MTPKPDFWDDARYDRVDVRVVAVEWRWGVTGHRRAAMESAAKELSRVPGVQLTAWSRNKVHTVHLVDGPSSPAGTPESEYARLTEALNEGFVVAAATNVGGVKTVAFRVNMISNTWDFLLPEAERKARELLAPMDTHQCDGHLCCCRATGLERDGQTDRTLGVIR